MPTAGSRRKARVGLLGGIGPEATGIFYLSLIAKLQKSGRVQSNTNFPQIVVNSINAPELVRNTELGAYIRGLKQLDAFGVDFIAMVCNTVHSFYEPLQEQIDTPIIDLRREVRDFLIREEVESAVVLATPTSLQMGLYGDCKVRYYRIESTEIDALGDAVLNFNSGTEKEKQRTIVERIAHRYTDMGAELVISGCTEISLMLEDSKVNKLDTMDLLCEAVARRCLD
ncbi:MAG: aspartate/glutamate racemase family protein [Candidatus Micrarchaeota archaeon]|nr:aspartate/glutamate racemase family protein [Candidatus Micrarchaeota archaeon]